MEIKSEQAFSKMVLESSKPALVDFWAPWCGPCHMVSPVVEALSKEYDGRLNVYKLNVDEVPAVAQRYNIMSIPTIAVFKDGEMFDHIIGAVLKEQIEACIKPLMEREEER